MGILCAFGRHRPAPDPTWNKGWYFTQCERCGVNLVRTGSGKWHVPKGRKVVWKERSPRGRKPGDDGTGGGAGPDQSDNGAPASAVASSSDQPGGR